MCIMTNGGGPAGHQPTITSRGQAGRGWMKGSMGGARKNFARLFAVLGAHPLGDVIAGRMSPTDWVRFELAPSAHDPACRWRRVCARIGWT